MLAVEYMAKKGDRIIEVLVPELDLEEIDQLLKVQRDKEWEGLQKQTEENQTELRPPVVAAALYEAPLTTSRHLVGLVWDDVEEDFKKLCDYAKECCIVCHKTLSSAYRETGWCMIHDWCYEDYKSILKNRDLNFNWETLDADEKRGMKRAMLCLFYVHDEICQECHQHEEELEDGLCHDCMAKKNRGIGRCNLCGSPCSDCN